MLEAGTVLVGCFVVIGYSQSHHIISFSLFPLAVEGGGLT